MALLCGLFCPKQLHGFDRLILHLHDLDHAIPDLDADAGLGNILQDFKQQTVESLGAVQRKIERESLVDVAQRGAAFE